MVLKSATRNSRAYTIGLCEVGHMGMVSGQKTDAQPILQKLVDAVQGSSYPLTGDLHQIRRNLDLKGLALIDISGFLY